MREHLSVEYWATRALKSMVALSVICQENCLSLAPWSFQGRCSSRYGLIFCILLVDCLKDFARIEQPVRIQTSLDCLHHPDSVKPQLVYEAFLLAEADTMFAGTSPVLGVDFSMSDSATEE